MHTTVYRRMAAVFPYFSGKRQQRGKYIKCAKVRTKKEVYSLNVAKSGIKKSFVTR